MAVQQSINLKFFPLLVLLLSIAVAPNWTATEYGVRQAFILELRQDVSMDQFLTEASALTRNGNTMVFQKTLSKRLNLHLIEFEGTAAEGLAFFKRHPLVQEVQTDGKVEFRESRNPNDENLSLQWGLDQIDAPEAWMHTTGGITALGDTIVIAVLDKGFDILHNDLVGNLWKNREEIWEDSIDNDNNGYVDDLYGWDYKIDSPYFGASQHGQSVVGILGAKGNNEIGVSGINWNVKVMLFRIDLVSDVIAAYDYVIEMRRRYNETNGKNGAFVVATNASFGQKAKFCDQQPIWGAMYDQLGAVGVLTGAGTANNNWDVESVGDVPTTCESEFLIATLNTNDKDQKHSGSAYGEISIDLGSPGENSYTTKLNNSYGFFGSNSAAAPHLTGAIALLYANKVEAFAEMARKEPAATALYVRHLILRGVDVLPDLAGLNATSGRLSIGNSMNLLLEDFSQPDENFLIESIYPNPAGQTINIRYQTTRFEPLRYQVFNNLGQIMQSGTFEPVIYGDRVYALDLSANLKAGVYYISISNGNEQDVKPVIVR